MGAWRGHTLGSALQIISAPVCLLTTLTISAPRLSTVRRILSFSMVYCMVASFPPGQARLCFVPAAFAGTAPDGARRLRIVIKISIPQSGRNAKPPSGTKSAARPAEAEHQAAKSQKQAEGNAPERRRPFWTPSGGNAASSPVFARFCGKVSLCALRKRRAFSPAAFAARLLAVSCPAAARRPPFAAAPLWGGGFSVISIFLSAL